MDAAVAASGRLVIVEGVAGIGKTTLLAAAAASAGQRGCMVLSARGGVLERTLGYGVVRQLFESLIASAPARLRRALLAGAARLATPILGLELPHRASDAVPATANAFASMHGLYWLASNLSDRRPLVLVVDDAQWCDEDSARWLLYLARRLEGMSVAVLIGVRTSELDGPDELLDTLAGQPAVQVIRPAALSVAATGTLLERAYGSAPEPRFRDACHQWTRGNPWLVSELATELVAEGIEPRAAAIDRMRRLAPGELTRVTLLRISRLPADAIELTRAAAVLGLTAELREAAELAGLDDADATRAADQLVNAHILEPGLPLRFVHPLIRGVVYGDLGPARRAADHKRAARSLDAGGEAAERVAVHLLESAPAAEAWVVERLRAAARDELARGSAVAAARMLRRALAEPPAPDDRSQVLLELGRAQFLAQDPAAVGSLQDAAAASRDPAQRAEAALVLGRILILAGQGRAAVAELERVIDAVAPRQEVQLELEAMLITAARSDMELLSVAEDRAKRIATVARPDNHAGRMVCVQLAYQAAIDGASVSATVALAREALGGGKLLREAPDSPDGYMVPISMLAICDELEEAAARYVEAIALTRSSGRGVAFAATCALSSWNTQLMGRLADAELEARDALAIVADTSALGAIAGFATGHLLNALLDRGELDEAESLLGADWTVHVESSGTWARNLLFSAGRLRAQQGRSRDAADLLLACGRKHAQARIGNPAFLPWRSEAGLALHSLGESAQARELVGEELALARRFGARRPIGIALRAAGLIEGGAPGLDLLHESADMLRDSPALLERARSLVTLGAALRRAGQRAQARELLREGLDLAAACESPPLTEQARAELRATGSRPRSDLRRGVDALTPSERRVAGMAASGLSNPEIAQALFVTRATVESHLHASYRKLEIASRDELPAALSDEPASRQQYA